MAAIDQSLRSSPPASRPAVAAAPHSPFDLADDAAYRAWRARKLAQAPQAVDELIVDVADPRRLTPGEAAALRARIARCNLAIYRGPDMPADEDLDVAPQLGRQLGLVQLDRNWLAEEDGVSRITVSDARDGEGRGGFIPYTDRPINWHTDGYYHPQARRIRSMILHCVRPAAQGGLSSIADHEMLYIALRDADPRWVQALMADDAMTIPARDDADGEARAAQTGPVFAVEACGQALHMRYTARTRSIAWKRDAATQEAVDFIARWLDAPGPHRLQLRLAAGMGIVAHNPPHARSAFADDAAAPRLLHRARFLDRVS